MPTVLLRPYVHTIRNRFRHDRAGGHHGKRDLLLLLVTFIVMICIFSGFVMILRSLSWDRVLAEVIPTKIIELICYAFFFLLLISNTVAHCGNIYSANNMNLLLLAPISSLRLFVTKLLESIIETTVMLLVFLVPVGAAYLYVLELPFSFLLSAALLAVPFVLTISSLAMVLATAFIKVASIIWKRGKFLLLAIMLMLGWGLLRLIEMLEHVQLRQGGTNAIVQMIGLFDNPSPLWLPSRWTADLLSYFITGRIEAPFLKLSLLCSSALGAMGIAYLVFDSFMLRVRASADLHEHPETKGTRGRATRPDLVRRLLEAVYYRIPMGAQVRAIILKDLTSLVRDRGQSLQLLLYLGIAAVYLVLTKFMSAALLLNPIAEQAWWGFLASVNILFTGFIVTAMMTRLVFPSISLEGRSFWILLVGPIALRRLIVAKFWCWLPLTLILSESLIMAGVFTIYPITPLILSSAAIAFFMAIGCTGVAIGVGSIFASFEWESPNQISSGFGTLALLLTSLTLVLITCIPASILTFLTAVPAARAKLGLSISPWVMGTCMVAIAAINLGSAYVACRRGARSLAMRRV